jgi:hypothetical protein
MNNTNFAGLTQLAPGEPLSTDGFAFQSVDPAVTDFLLNVGVQTHRHNARPALDAPASAASAVVASGGLLPPDQSIVFTYTLLDDRGGETLPAPGVSVVTFPRIPEPTQGPSGTVDYSAGSLLAGTYHYVLTYRDSTGHETGTSPYAAFTRDPGFASGRVLFAGLNSSMPAGAVGWRLYKSSLTGAYKLLAQGTGATFIDDGTVPADAATSAPTVNRTGSFSRAEITIPALASGATGFRLYGSLTGAFESPALLGEFAAGHANPILITTFDPDLGRPPVRPTAVAGASLIDPDTELLDWHWKRPVASASMLPASGNTLGDVRVTTNDGLFNVWLASGMSGYWFTQDIFALTHWRGVVSTAGSLPAGGNSTGDVRVTVDDFRIHIWDGSSWLDLETVVPPEQAATLLNSWTNFGTGNPAWFYKHDERVYLSGSITGGASAASGSIAFQLPVGYRPTYICRMTGMSDSSGTRIACRVVVDTSGNVILDGYGPTWASIDGLSFRV